MKPLLAILAFTFAAGVSAATVYKTVGPDGKVIYTDQPNAEPVKGGSTQTLEIQDLPSSPLPDSVLKYRQELEASANRRAAQNAAPRPGVARLYVRQDCTYCQQAREWLRQNGVSFVEIDITTADGRQEFLQSGGSRGVPYLTWQNKSQRGFSAAGYQRFFAAK